MCHALHQRVYTSTIQSPWESRLRKREQSNAEERRDLFPTARQRAIKIRNLIEKEARSSCVCCVCWCGGLLPLLVAFVSHHEQGHVSSQIASRCPLIEPARNTCAEFKVPAKTRPAKSPVPSIRSLLSGHGSSTLAAATNQPPFNCFCKNPAAEAKQKRDFACRLLNRDEAITKRQARGAQSSAPNSDHTLRDSDATCPKAGLA